MFPIRDHNPSNKLPIITVFLIIFTALVFYFQLTAFDPEVLVRQYALIPNLVDFSKPLTLLPFLYSIFLHGGWFHLISNMWFLWIFGDNVEAILGHLTFAFFYLVSGFAAGFIQYLFDSSSTIPTLGASGAVAGVLGAYFVLYPKHKVDTLVVGFGGFFQKIQLPASFILGYWFIVQFVSGVHSIGGNFMSGIAWWAHIGGFVAGWLIIKIFVNKKKLSEASYKFK